MLTIAFGIILAVLILRFLPFFLDVAVFGIVLVILILGTILLTN